MRQSITGVLILFCWILISCNTTHDAKSEQKAESLVKEIYAEYLVFYKNNDYNKCLGSLNKILRLCRKYQFGVETEYSMLDRKQFILHRTGKFKKALKAAFELEELSAQTQRGPSSWDYLKIADSYLGLNDMANALKYIEKAVLERGFENYRYLSGESYLKLKDNKGFKDVVDVMKSRIGLDLPARDFSIPLTTGDEFTLTDNIGSVVLIDFWDMKCAPCIKSIPELNRLFSEYNREGLEIIGISLDTDKDALLSFIKEKGMKYPVACSFLGWSDSIAIRYNIKATPSTWLVDRTGTLRYYNPDGADLEQLICELLKE
jgi:peroxiredoxin